MFCNIVVFMVEEEVFYNQNHKDKGYRNAMYAVWMVDESSKPSHHIMLHNDFHIKFYSWFFKR